MKELLEESFFPFINRDLSWLNFNERVLEEAEDPLTPLFEKLRFLSIYSDNLDEFFMIRVAGYRQKLQHGQFFCDTPDGLEISSLMGKMRHKILFLQQRQESVFSDLCSSELKKRGLHLLSYSELSNKQKDSLDVYFEASVYPALTPLNVDVSHPFPYLSNLVSYLAFELEESVETKMPLSIGLIQIPSLLERLIEIPEEGYEKRRNFILLEDLVSNKADTLFQKRIKSKVIIRVTRDFDYSLEKRPIHDFKKSVAEKINERHNQKAVRLQYTIGASPSLLSMVKKKLGLNYEEMYLFSMPYDYRGIKELVKLPYPKLKFPLFNPRIPSHLGLSEDIFKCIGDSDLLVHHPFESFYTVGEFIRTASKDPHTVAIRQTLYRSSGNSPIIGFLMEAARNGKDVTVVIELTARFDEQANIDWSRRLEHSGAKVVYGFVGMKTHCKLTLVLRKENGKLAKYTHLSTGNYNPQTANLYTDLGLLTKNEEIANDAVKVFNILTGLNGMTFRDGSSLRKVNLPPLKRLILAPLSMRRDLISFIRGVSGDQMSEAPGLIIIKVNALIEPRIIKELYAASSRGVKIHLIVRGACSLRPGLEGISKNIIVTSIVDRFLEHSRIFYFKSSKIDKLYLGSADLMGRNLNSRIEILFPILQESIKNRVIGQILHTYSRDNVKARYLLSDGSYVHAKQVKKKIQAQSKFIEIARSDGFKSHPYKKAIYYYLRKKGTRPIVYDS